MRDRPVQKLNIGGRANLLEEMGRIDARKHPDAADRAEKRRVIGELNKGYKHGNRVKKEMVVQQPNIIFNMDMDRIKVLVKLNQPVKL